MDVSEKIINYLKDIKYATKANLSSVKVTSEKNKQDENLLYVRATKFEQKNGTNYFNDAVYYGFNSNGDFIGRVYVTILNVNPPTQVEMEYYSNEKFKNQGNITVLAKEVIKDIFEEKTYDNLKVQEDKPLSSIDTIMGSINDDNYASLAVARKLGFDENCYMTIDDYRKRNLK